MSRNNCWGCACAPVPTVKHITPDGIQEADARIADVRKFAEVHEKLTDEIAALEKLLSEKREERAKNAIHYHNSRIKALEALAGPYDDRIH